MSAPTADVRAELERRVAEVRADPDETESWLRCEMGEDA